LGRRISVVVAATVLLGGFLMALTLTQPRPACGCTLAWPGTISNLVRIGPEGSVGLVTVTAGGGEVRTNPTTGEVETSVTVAPTSWVGTIPTTLRVTNDVAPHPPKRLLRTVISSRSPSLEAFRPGTQWVVRVRNADAQMGGYPLPLVGNTVQTPGGRLIDDVDGANPRKVSLDALRGRARRYES
jgi:hypothetical protein